MSTTHPTSSHIRILLAEEDETIRVFLEDNLTADGYRVATATDRDDALCQLRTIGADLILVDVNGQTLGLIDWVRSADPALCAIASDTPVIVLTSHPEELDRVRLLERGGDDVIAKPFSYPELRARIVAVLRRTAPRQAQPVLSAGPLRLDPHRRTVTVAGRVVELSAIEYRLLHTLASEPSRVFTRVR
jgi:DNA-binding response OmpR family regulator